MPGKAKIAKRPKKAPLAEVCPDPSAGPTAAPSSPSAAALGISPVGAPEGKAAGGKTTLADASRDRLAKPLVDRELWSDFENVTGERIDPDNPPTWAELIAARQARRAATSESGTRDAKDLREAAEGSKSNSTRVAFLLSLDGLPRTNAVTQKTSEGS